MRRQGHVPEGRDGGLRPERMWRDDLRRWVLRYIAVRREHVLRGWEMCGQEGHWSVMHGRQRLHERILRRRILLQQRVCDGVQRVQLDGVARDLQPREVRD